MHLTNDRSNAFPQLCARVCKAITGEHCKALFKCAETSWCSELDGNKLTKRDLHRNKRKGSWEKKSEIMNWFWGLLWNMVPFFVCQHKQLKQWTPTLSLSWSGLGTKNSELWGFQNISYSNLEARWSQLMAGLSVAHGTKSLFYMGAFCEDLWERKICLKFFFHAVNWLPWLIPLVVPG